MHVAGKGAAEASAEVLAAMYDKSLDAFAPLGVQSPLELYPNHEMAGFLRPSLGASQGQSFAGSGFDSHISAPNMRPDILIFLSGYGIGGLGIRNYAFGGGRGGAGLSLAAPSPTRAKVAFTGRRPRRLLTRRRPLLPAKTRSPTGSKAVRGCQGRLKGQRFQRNRQRCRWR